MGVFLMSDESLDTGIQYARAEKERGVPEDAIRKSLLESGWSPRDADEVLRRIDSGRGGYPEIVSSRPVDDYESRGSYRSNEGHGYVAKSRSRFSIKGTLLMLGGAALLLLALGVGIAAFAGNGPGRVGRGLVALVIIGAALLKKGYDCFQEP